jgi:hypothetical protein
MTNDIIQVNILEDQENTSDHFELSVELDLKCPLTITTKTIKDKNSTIAWDKIEVQFEYQYKLDQKLKNINITELKNCNKSKAKIIISKFINEFNSVILSTVKEMVEEKKSINRHVKRKSWWDDEMQELKNRLYELYAIYNQTKDEYIKQVLIKEARKKFRQKQKDKIRNDIENTAKKP